MLQEQIDEISLKLKSLQSDVDGLSPVPRINDQIHAQMSIVLVWFYFLDSISCVSFLHSVFIHLSISMLIIIESQLSVSNHLRHSHIW